MNNEQYTRQLERRALIDAKAMGYLTIEPGMNTKKLRSIYFHWCVKNMLPCYIMHVNGNKAHLEIMNRSLDLFDMKSRGYKVRTPALKLHPEYVPLWYAEKFMRLTRKISCELS